MTLSSTRRDVILSARHQGWSAPETTPRRLSDVSADPQPGQLRLTSRVVSRDGAPLIPVTGELHYSRVPRARWRRRLAQMKAGGITAVSTYIIWLHHQPTTAAPDFSGDLDIRAFMQVCREVGLPIVLRIGPWVHGEVRNGGLPDWVQHSGAMLRTNDPAYVAPVTAWFTAIAGEIADLCQAGDSVVAIQVDNELYDQPEHLRTLKLIAQAVGLTAPIYSATGWGSAQLPAGELLPLFGGYGDGFWVETDAPWERSFREHFFYSHRWDDPGIGADLRASDAIQANTSEPGFSGFPAATCELGGGMATAYHRRPLLAALDIAAVAHTKIGNGSAWQGYYMYAGGRNPLRDGPTQESHATGYPNDMPRWDYDFHAPIGVSGTLAESAAHLRRQHTFLDAFGDRLAPMSSSLPDDGPLDVADTETLRWALRSDGDSGFVLINWHQPYEPLADHEAVRFRLDLDRDTVVFPADPIAIPAGTLAHWPVGLTLAGVKLEWATASAHTILPGPVPTLVLTAEQGIVPQLHFGDDVVVTVVDGKGTATIDRATAVVHNETLPLLLDARRGDDRIHVLVLPFRTGLASWMFDGRLLVSESPLWPSGVDGVGGESLDEPDVQEFDPFTGRFVQMRVLSRSAVAHGSKKVSVVQSARPGTPPLSYGSLGGRASAPGDGDFAIAARFTLDIMAGAADEDLRRELVIEWEGDVARLLIGGEPVADRFWDGTPWSIDLDALDPLASGAVEVQILPLVPAAHIHLAAGAAAQRALTNEALCAISAVEVRNWVAWTEVRNR